MNDFKVSFFKSRFRLKPSTPEAAMLSTIIGGKIETINRDNIESFVSLVGNEGCTFCPATFKGGKRSKETFDQSQLLALDYDNKNPDSTISFEAVKKRAEKYDIPILFAYDTFTSNNHNKFRAVFLNDAAVHDIRASEAMLQGLTTIFPEADPQSKSAVQMYYGGKGLLHFDPSLPQINVESLFRNMTMYLKDNDTNYRRKVAEISRTTGIRLNDNKLLDISVINDYAEDIGTTPVDKNSPKSSIIIKATGEKLSKYYKINFGENSTKPLGETKRSKTHLPYRSRVIDNIRSGCQLYREFESGERRLHHPERFGLATNLVHVETGAARFKDILRSTSYYDDRPEKYSAWDYYLHYVKGYKPFACDGFCPHSAQCSHGTNILTTAKVKYHQWERVTGYYEPLFTLDEAVKDFQRNLQKALLSTEMIWHIIKAQTALGKTEAILKLVRDTQLNVLIVVPTNKLKREIRKRAKKMGIEMVVSPSLREYENNLPEDVWEHIESLYDSGKQVIPYLKKIISEDEPACSALFKKFINELDKFRNYEGHAITTHRRFLTLDVSKYDLVIVDEDIIFNTIIPNKTDISIRDLRKLRKKLPANCPLARKINKVLKYIKTEEFFTLSKIPFDKDYDDIPMGVDIPSLCSAIHFCYRKVSDRESGLTEDCVTFLNPVEFNKNTKFIMVSATVDETICEYFFKDNMKFYNCKKARLEGIINQYYNRTMSRMDLAKDPTIIDIIKKWSGFNHTISFKKFMKYYLGDLHFGNCAGCDYMKGENIDVIGTPHQPEWIYKLFAFSLGLEFGAEDRIKPGVTAVHNGWRFRFATYESSEELRAIQFYMIESQLEQAIGRARLLRCDCTVNLFSNFPLSQSNPMVFDYDKNAAEYSIAIGERKEPIMLY